MQKVYRNKLRRTALPQGSRGQQRRATDMIWSWNSFHLDRIIENPGQRILYYLAEPAPTRAFVSEELMQIAEDTQLPPDYVKKW